MVGAVAMDSGDDAGDGGGAGGARPKPANLPWLSAKAWDQVLAYQATLGPPFAGLPEAIESASTAWKVYSWFHARVSVRFCFCFSTFCPAFKGMFLSP